MSREPRNLAASVRDRLLNRAQQRGEDFQFILQRYAAERFLYRLGESRHRNNLVLKGAMLFPLWGGSAYRPTRDLDFTGYGSSDTDKVLHCIREICTLAVKDDGIVFDATTLAADAIRDDSEHDGLRIRLRATLGTALIHVQIDIGFGNAVKPVPAEVDYPTLLDSPAPHIRAYPREAVIAEKFHALVLLGERTSRFKDYCDLYLLANRFPFDGTRLTQAIAVTFKCRRTPTDNLRPAALAPRFFADPSRAAQWRTYLQRPGLPGAPVDFDMIGELLRAFFGPPLTALAESRQFESSWRPGGRWQAGEGRSDRAVATLVIGAKARLEPEATISVESLDSGKTRRPAEVPLRRFKPYGEYKDSGVEWLGKIPAHWHVLRLKYVAPVIDNRAPEGTSHLPYVGLEHVESGTGRLVSDPEEITTECDETEGAATLFQSGDVLFGKLRPYLAKVLTPDFGGRCSTELLVLRSAGALAPCLLAYQLLSRDLIGWINAMTYRTKMPRANPGQVMDTPVAVAPAEEQRALAAFLDRETAKIDALVAKKERLIELLQEKRTALITRAVTKGLDPNVPMKDSGVEWLGQIPAHWEVKRLWHLTPCDRRIMYGIVLPGPNVEVGVPIVKGGDVSPGGLRLDSLSRTTFEIESAHSRSRLKAGDLVYAIRGSIGEVAVIPDELDGANLTQDAARVAYTSSTHGYWLLYALKSSAVFAQLEAGALGATVRGINIRDLKRACIPAPPRAEQDDIAAFLTTETAKMDSLVNRVRDATERLRELRTALISATVTGKIDVR